MHTSHIHITPFLKNVNSTLMEKISIIYKAFCEEYGTVNADRECERTE